jgi:hypothetical protein
LASGTHLSILYLLKPKQKIIKNGDFSNQISLRKILSYTSIKHKEWYLTQAMFSLLFSTSLGPKA